jgi:ADP-ribose pyrophosphatase YjhB (NUDIX family)
MAYKISEGLPEGELKAWLAKAADRFGVFADGRVDYKRADIAPIILCVVTCGEEFLLLKRGYGLADAEGYWSVVTGFIDEVKPVKQQVVQEIKEELGLSVDPNTVRLGRSYTLQNSQEKRGYIIFPARLSLLRKPRIVLSDEHTDHVWITKEKLDKYKILDDLPHAIEVALQAQYTEVTATG